MRSDVSESLRRLVAISRKHHGSSEPSNLAYACLRCNAWKGSDLVTIDASGNEIIRHFHPRLQRWKDHFILRGAVIEPLTDEGDATAGFSS